MVPQKTGLEGHTALVTGGAVRIGAAICRALAARGCDVVVHCSRSGKAARLLARELKASGVRAWVVRQPFGGGHSPSELVDAAWDAAGRVDILVNNAAVFRKRRLAEAAEAAVREELDVNLVTPILLVRRFVQRLCAGRSRRAGIRGRIVNLLDRRVATHEAGCLPYVASKKGLEEFTASAALELAPLFAVNAVAPGAILPPPGSGADYLRDAAGPVPLRVRCTPEHVAEAVVSLLLSDVMTGQTLFVDGGQHLANG